MKKMYFFVGLILSVLNTVVYAQGGLSCSEAVVAINGTNRADNAGSVDQWFKYTATADGKIAISTCGLTSADTRLYVYDSCGGTLVVGSDDDCARQTNAVFPCVANTTYYINWGPNFTSASYDWELNESVTEPGDFCDMAIAVDVGTHTNTSSFLQETWYSYTATRNGKLTISSCGLTTEDTQLQVYSECGGFSQYSSYDFCGAQSKVAFEVISGTSYYFSWVNTSNLNPFDWSLSIDDWAVGEDCSVPKAAVTGATNLADHSSATDQWFSYTATMNGKITISSCGQTAEYTNLLVYTDCNSFLDGNRGGCGDQSLLTFECTAGTEYLICWDNNYLQDVQYNWTLTEELPEQGDFCSNPLLAVDGDNAFTANVNEEQWFEFTATRNGKIEISSCGATLDDTQLEIYSSCNSYASESSSNFCDQQSKLVIEGVTGTSYLIKWKNVSSSNGFTWTLNELDWAEGEDCSIPKTAVLGNTNTADHTAGADQWFSYVAASAGKVTFSSCGTATGYTRLYVYDACGGNLLGSSYWDCGSQSTLTLECAVGTEFFVKWDKESVNGTQYQWSISEEAASPGDFCSMPISAAAGSNAYTAAANVAQWFEYTATRDGKIVVSSCGLTADNTNVEVYSSCGGSAIVSNNDYCNTQSEVSFEGVTGTIYLIKWENSSTSNGFNWTLNETDWAQGEQCTNPIAATLGATNFADHTDGFDQWYSYTAAYNGQLIINTCNLTIEDTYIYLYDACGGLQLARQDDFCSLQSQVTIDCVVGQEFVIRMASVYTSGSYNWSLEETGVPTSIASKEFANVSLFPNPTQGVINVKSDIEVDRVEVYALSGALMFASTDVANKITLNLEKGIYIALIKLVDGSISKQKLVVE